MIPFGNDRTLITKISEDIIYHFFSHVFCAIRDTNLRQIIFLGKVLNKGGPSPGICPNLWNCCIRNRKGFIVPAENFYRILGRKCFYFGIHQVILPLLVTRIDTFVLPPSTNVFSKNPGPSLIFLLFFLHNFALPSIFLMVNIRSTLVYEFGM
jgi:hypothetical protein